MTALSNGVAFSLACAANFADRSVAEKIAEALLSFPESVRPIKFGAFKANQPILSSEQLVKAIANEGSRGRATAGSLIAECSEECGYQVQWNDPLAGGLPFIAGYLMSSDTSRQLPLADFQRAVRELVMLLQPAYGELRSTASKGWDTPMALQVRLPDVPNVSIYGPEYIQMFGEQNIERAPFIDAEKIGRCYWLTAHDPITDPVPAGVRAGIRNFLGEDAFMADGKWRYSDGRAPRVSIPRQIPST